MVTVQSQTSPGPDQGQSLQSKYFTSQNVKTAALCLLAICIPYNIFLSHNLSVEKGLRQQETGLLAKGAPRSDPEYIPASIEDYIITNAGDLGYDSPDYKVAKGCTIWNTPSASTAENYNHLQEYHREINAYAQAIKDFDTPIAPLLKTMNTNGRGNWAETCKKLRPHPDGIQALFPSKQLSYMNGNGFMEPLTTPMRHPDFCDDGLLETAMRLDYLVHDFEAMCMKLKPHSKTILIDMGASLQFHSQQDTVPIVNLMKEYEKFGFHFDHIYAFEVKNTDPNRVYNDLLPLQYFPSYHWINTGVSADLESKMNPLKSIVAEYTEDDFIVIKLDIDTSSIEVPLAKQLLEDDSINQIIDHFYFEHHVNIQEVAKYWGPSMEGTIKESFDLMNGLRKKGVAAHFWV